MDEFRRHHKTAVHVTPQTLHNFKIHDFIIIQYYSIILHIIIQK